MKLNPEKLEKALKTIRHLKLADVLKREAEERTERQRKRRKETYGF